MSVLSFCIECVDHNKIPLESIAKFFNGQRVGIVTWIDVVEYINVSMNGALPQDNLRRLYVHFEKNEHLLEKSELFTQGLSVGNNVWKIGGIESEIYITISINKNPEHTKKNEATTYAFDISGDVWLGTFDNSRKWSIHEIINNEDVKYNNLHKDNFDIFQYLEKHSFPDPLIVEENLEEEEERRVDLLNPTFDFDNKYTTQYGEIGFTKDEYKDFYGNFWKHYWDDSIIWEQYYPIIHSCMTLDISITIGPLLPPHSNVMKYLIDPIEQKMQDIEYISYYYTHNQNNGFVCEMETGRVSYFIANMNVDFKDIDDIGDFYKIKNTLRDIEQMCEVLKPKDIYNYMHHSKIYINFE